MDHLTNPSRHPDAASRNLHDVCTNLRQRPVLKMPGVGVELADAFRKLLGRHGVFVVRPTERRLIQVEAIAHGCARCFWIELTRYDSVSLLQLLKEVRADGK